jgi:uncharacterized SAM-binding protein YcdF (DUF218 family)
MLNLLKVLGIIALLIMVLLIPLFAIYVASAQALPGEGRYPLKTQSEKIIDQLTSVYPEANSYFSLLKSQRRYQELIGLSQKKIDITEVNQKFLDQTKQTLFDIQSVSNTSSRLNYLAQYQSFVSNAKINLSYETDRLKDDLGADKTKSIKTFSVDSFEVDQGKLVATKKNLVQKGINQKDQASNELIIKNIEQLELAQITLQSLMQK